MMCHPEESTIPPAFGGEHCSIPLLKQCHPERRARGAKRFERESKDPESGGIMIAASGFLTKIPASPFKQSLVHKCPNFSVSLCLCGENPVLRASAVNYGFLPNTSLNNAVVCAIGSFRIFFSSSAIT